MSASHFELLGLPPTAAINQEVLQQAYIDATRTAHPDQGSGDGHLAAELNAAVEVLQSPVTRLRHLMEVGSDTPWRSIPLDASMMTIFERLGPLLQKGAAFLAKKRAATTALARALQAPEEMQLREALEELGTEIESKWSALERELPQLDCAIVAGDETVWSRLQAIQAQFAYLAKWRHQMRELLLELML